MLPREVAVPVLRMGTQAVTDTTSAERAWVVGTTALLVVSLLVLDVVTRIGAGVVYRTLVQDARPGIPLRCVVACSKAESEERPCTASKEASIRMRALMAGAVHSVHRPGHLS